MSYLNAHLGKDHVVQAIFGFDPTKPDGEQYVFKHGYVVADGEMTGLVDGSMRVDHAGIVPEAVTLSVTTERDTAYALTGAPAAFGNWLPYGVCLTGHSMLRWTSESGQQGVGTLMESFPLDSLSGDNLHEDVRLSGPAACGSRST